MAAVVGISLVTGMVSTAAADPVTPDPTVSVTEAAPDETTATPEELAVTPSEEPSVDPSEEPSGEPTVEPTGEPTVELSPDAPTVDPSTLPPNPNPGLSDADRFGIGGYIPWQGDTSVIDDASYSSGLLKAGTLPLAYNLRDNNRSWQPGIRDQGGFGTCWSFASAEAAESSLVRNGVLKASTSSTSRQVSSLHTVQSVYYTNTFKANTKHPLSATGPYQQGGNTDMAATAWSHWYGAQKRSSFNDPTKFSKAPARISAAKLKTSAYHLRNYWQLPRAYNSSWTYIQSNVDAIKSAIYTYGALSTAVAFNSDYFNGSYFYDPFGDSTNHAVAIIGWNDSIYWYQFNTYGYTPAGNGAFLIQNSWGKSSQYTYFWVSYYDTSLSNTAVFDLGGAKASAGRRSPFDWTVNYSYDKLGLVGGAKLGASGSISFANKFTAKSKSALRAVQIATRQPNTSYSVTVYVGGKSTSVTSGGKAATIGAGGVKTLYGYATFAGYQTLTLDIPVVLKKGQKFTIMVTESASSGYTYLPAESSVAMGKSGTARPTIGKHQSYILNGKWQDARSTYKAVGVTGSVGNVNVIGLASPVPKYVVKYDANGGKVKPSSKSVTFKASYGKLAKPTRKGYTFAGWYTAASGGTRVSSATKMSSPSTKTIYAHWR